MKYLVLIAIVLTVLWLARSPGRGAASQGTRARPGTPGTAGTPATPQAMVECPACGVHLPQTEALAAPDGRMYCCAEHRRRGAG